MKEVRSGIEWHERVKVWLSVARVVVGIFFGIQFVHCLAECEGPRKFAVDTCIVRQGVNHPITETQLTSAQLTYVGAYFYRLLVVGLIMQFLNIA